MNRTDTELIPAPWLRPSVTATYRTPRARVTHVARRVARSPFVEDVRRYGWLIGLLLASVLCVAIPLLTRGQFVAWDSVHTIPTGGVR